jgi:hypothetical protein
MAIIEQRVQIVQPAAARIPVPARVQGLEPDRVAGIDGQDGRQVDREVPVQGLAAERDHVCGRHPVDLRGARR